MRTQPGTAREGMEYCNRLYAVEQELAESSPEERFNKRQELSRPILESFYTWLKQTRPKVLPKGVLGKAINYCLSQWENLTAFLEDGRLELDNNRSERSIKPFVIGRKNWLFSNTPKGATASATIYSIVETAISPNFHDLDYTSRIRERITKHELFKIISCFVILFYTLLMNEPNFYL